MRGGAGPCACPGCPRPGGTRGGCGDGRGPCACPAGQTMLEAGGEARGSSPKKDRHQAPASAPHLPLSLQSGEAGVHCYRFWSLNFIIALGVGKTYINFLKLIIAPGRGRQQVRGTPPPQRHEWRSHDESGTYTRTGQVKMCQGESPRKDGEPLFIASFSIAILRFHQPALHLPPDQELSQEHPLLRIVLFRRTSQRA